MKKGDIVIMPGQSTSVEPASVGILVSSENDGKRVLVLWNDAEGVAYEEPRAWLAVCVICQTTRELVAFLHSVTPATNT